MRHAPKQLHDLLFPYADAIFDALHAATHQAMLMHGKKVFDHERGLYSHQVRCCLFRYLEAEPIPGLTLDIKAYRGSVNPVVLHHDATGVTLRIRVLGRLSYAPADPALPGMETMTDDKEGLFSLDGALSDETILLAWEYPEFDEDGAPKDTIPVTVVRLAQGTSLKEGKADCIFRLPGARTFVPDTSFDPNQTDYNFNFGADYEEASGDE